MNCEQARETVLESFDGPLKAQLQLAMQDHITTCEACRRFAELQQTIDARLAEALPPPCLSVGFRRSLREKLPEPAAPSWSESLPDIAHLAGCAFGVVLLLLTMPQYSNAILVAGGGFTVTTYFLQAVLRSSLERVEPANSS